MKLLLVATAVLGALALPGGAPRVVAREGDRIVAEMRLPSSGAFALTYRHSVYRAPAVERFRRVGDGFELVAISSPSEAVLDYYEVEGTRARRDGWWMLRLARPARFEAMPLAATAVGRRTLVAGGKRVPLWGDGVRHVTIAVKD